MRGKVQASSRSSCGDEGDDKESCLLSRTGDLEEVEVCWANGRVSGIGVREFFNFEGVTVAYVECWLVDDGGLVVVVLAWELVVLGRRAFVAATISVGIDRDLPWEEVEEDEE